MFSNNSVISFNNIILYAMHRYQLSKALSSINCYQRYLHVSIARSGHAWIHSCITYNNLQLYITIIYHIQSNLDYPDFSIIQTFSLVPIILCHKYLLAMIEIRSNILFRSKFDLLLKNKSSIILFHPLPQIIKVLNSLYAPFA